MKVTESNLKNHFKSNGVHPDIVKALEGRGFFKKVVGGLLNATKLHGGIISAGKLTAGAMPKTTKRTANYQPVLGGKLTAGKIKRKKSESRGKKEKHYCECESDSEDGGKLTAGKIKNDNSEKQIKKVLKMIDNYNRKRDKKEYEYEHNLRWKHEKEKLPKSLKEYEKQVLAYKKKRDATTTKAMRAICKKESIPKRKLPPALKMHQKKVMEYREKYGVSLKEAMIALKKK